MHPPVLHDVLCCENINGTLKKSEDKDILTLTVEQFQRQEILAWQYLVVKKFSVEQIATKLNISCGKVIEIIKRIQRKIAL